MSVFKFKHFNVSQIKTAMKIGTDALIFGSTITAESSKTALDIGTGTGVLALMLAQRNNLLKIDALEINENAYEEACENIQQSPFFEKIKVIHADFKTYSFSNKYDLIFSNPPYFEKSTKSENSNRNQARHSDTLPLETLFQRSKELLTNNGRFCVILPNITIDSYITLCEEIGLFLTKEILIYGRPNKLSRKIVEFERVKKPKIQESITLRNEEGKYTQEYIKLTQEFHDRDLSIV